MIKNIIFDMGNVLVDFCWEKAFRDKGIDGDMLERVANATVRDKDWDEFDLANISHEQIINNFIENDPEIEKEIRIATSSIGDMIKKKTYAEDLIMSLQKAGYKVYILSNMSPEAFNEAGDDLKCNELADGSLFSCDCHLVKPDLEIYKLLLKKFNLKASECVFLDDKKENTDASEQCEIKGIVFKDLKDALIKLKSMGVDIDYEVK
ncbi:MAG: HAD-IA family hydrolase [Lachnospiraceae bacterium]|nr:HAD-IA family hydrolase [Lachnospiraceae bacterium]